MKLKKKEIFGNRVYHAAETVLISQEKTYEHDHDFYEVFLMIEGEMVHCCNGNEEHLVQNSLCLIHPSDSHYFYKKSSKAVHFVNLAFTKEIYEECIKVWELYCGKEAGQIQRTARIPGSLAQSLAAKIMYLMKIMPEVCTEEIVRVMESALMDSLTYLMDQKTSPIMIPDWLKDACQSMKEKENYREGLSRFVQLSGKSQEHLTRMMKRYYGKTPTAYLNAIRLEQTACLLRTTNESVLDIMLECGFNNVSHFNQRFREEFGLSPSRYRQSNRQVINPE